MPTNPEAGPRPKAGREGVLCAKCHHLNAVELMLCDLCGARLYINCEKCGRQNKRVASRCKECGARLHRSWWRRWKKVFVTRRGSVTVLQIAGAVVAAVLVYKIIVMVVEYSPPSE